MKFRSGSMRTPPPPPPPLQSKCENRSLQFGTTILGALVSAIVTPASADCALAPGFEHFFFSRAFTEYGGTFAATERSDVCIKCETALLFANAASPFVTQHAPVALSCKGRSAVHCQNPLILAQRHHCATMQLKGCMQLHRTHHTKFMQDDHRDCYPCACSLSSP